MANTHNAASAGTASLSADLRSGRMVALGDEKFLWALVFFEVAALFLMRQAFRRHHGG